MIISTSNIISTKSKTFAAFEKKLYLLSMLIESIEFKVKSKIKN